MSRTPTDLVASHLMSAQLTAKDAVIERLKGELKKHRAALEVESIRADFHSKGCDIFIQHLKIAEKAVEWILKNARHTILCLADCLVDPDCHCGLSALQAELRKTREQKPDWNPETSKCQKCGSELFYPISSQTKFCQVCLPELLKTREIRNCRVCRIELPLAWPSDRDACDTCLDSKHVEGFSKTREGAILPEPLNNPQPKEQ